MADQFIEHVTSDGERWDQIAERYYGDPLAYEAIVLANPHVPIIPVLDAGLRLQMPVPTEELVATSDDLPPWKR
ncbi:MAG: tail protein X [Gemmatimonadaceae bacterium]